MERILSRPHSPFKRSSRPPSRSGSPVRGVSTIDSRWTRASEEQPLTKSANEGSMPTAPSAAFAGPSSSPTGSPRANPHSHATTMRAEHYDVVLEGPQSETILRHLGDLMPLQLASENGAPQMSSSSSSSSVDYPSSPAKRSAPQPPNHSSNGASPSVEKFDARLHELLQTEKSYVQRIEALYQRYAVPLRQMARDRDTAIIPLYEAQRLFGNIGEIVGANKAFLRELEQYVSDRFKGKFRQEGEQTELGDIVYRNIACFTCYNEYFSNFEKAKHIEQTMMRSNKGFRDFVQRTKYSTAGLGNVGLRELIMEPVQRIPRYTLLFDGLIRNLPATEPNRARLEQAMVLASRIASCEVDDKTKRAAVLWSFSRNVDGFPAGLISVHRQYVDCIDVDDFPIDVLGPAAMNTLLSPGGANLGSSQSYRTIHCTLFLFDDIIAVAKRASSTSCGKALVGLDNLDKLADQMKTVTERSAAPKSPSKSELGFRGLINIADVRAVDMGGLDFQLLFKRPPTHTSGDKWAGRPIRQYASVDTQGTEDGQDPAMAREEKQRFLENLWKAQALYKTRDHRSHLRFSTISVADQALRRIIYWNVYGRHAYLMAPNKADIVLHVDLQGEADALPLGHDEMPAHASVRILSMDDDTAYCTYVTTFKNDVGKAVADAGEVHDVPLSYLADELFRTSKALQTSPLDFDPRRASPSPRSPSSSHRGKALASGLEQFGRSLFGTPSSLRSTTTGTGSDFWGGVKRQRSKGSSHFSRNPSTSTRQTYSTTQTSSIGSRGDAMGRSRMDTSTSGDLYANIERYRNGLSPGRADEHALTPTQKGADQSYSPGEMRRDGAVSPIRRKPVPSSMETEESPQRTHSGSYKRQLPSDATPTAKPTKRATRSSRDNGDEDDDEEDDDNEAPLMSSATESPPSPSPLTPMRNHSARSNASSNIVAPLSIRKDKGQARAMTRQEAMVKVQRDLDTLKRVYAESKRDVERARHDGRVAEWLDDCLMDLDSSQDVVRRIRDTIDAFVRSSNDDDESTLRRKEAADTMEPATSAHAEVKKLQTHVTTLTRKCELLASLEQDGRLENTELHKAFNEELDRMYDDAQLSEVDQVARLRAEVRRSKSERNEAVVEKRALQRDLALERAQSEVWRATLEKHGLI